MAWKWIQWLKDYNGNKIKLCVPVGQGAQEVAEDPDYYLSRSYQGWQPPDYNTWGIFPFNIALAQSAIANATANGCEDVNQFLASFGIGSSLQYHFVSNETITSQADSQYLQTYTCQFWRPSAGINLMTSFTSSVAINVDNNPHKYPAIAIDEETQRAIFVDITISKHYSDPDPTGGVTFSVLTQSDASRAQFYNKILSSVPPVQQDPYAGGGNANEQLDTGPSNGDFDDTSDAISLPSLPTLNLSASHLLTAYVPELQDIDDLADFMWGNFDHTDITKDLSKIFADPRDGIIALFMLPFEPDKSAVKTLAAIGAFPIAGLEMYTLTAQFKHVSCGSVSVTEYYGNYLDYNPYTRITLFLPFVGEVQLDPDEVMGQSVSVDYYVDCLTGAFVAFVSITDKILAQYQGNCSTQIPTTAADYTAVNSALLSAATAAVGLGVTVATGGAAATLAAAGTAASSAVGVMQSKVNHSHSGALGGAAGFLGSQTPYLLIHRARQSVPPDANAFKGYPCNGTFKLSDLRECGFTKVHDIILDNFGYSDAEMSELRQILADGVFL